MSNENSFTLITNNKIAYLNANSFDFDTTENLLEFYITDIYKNVEKFGNKILDGLKIETNHHRNNHYINDRQLKREINKFDIIGKEQVLNCVKEFNKIYNFPELDEKEAMSFAKELAILSLMFAFQRDLVLVSYNKSYKYNNPNTQTDYIENTLRPRIENLNTTGKLLFKEYKELEEENLLKCNNIKEIRKFLSSYKSKLLYAVNELSNEIKYSIRPRIDVQSRCVNITSDKVFHLIWHIFVNYIVADVAPSKLNFCTICGTLREQTTKKGIKCKKCKNRDIK